MMRERYTKEVEVGCPARIVIGCLGMYLVRGTSQPYVGVRVLLSTVCRYVDM